MHRSLQPLAHRLTTSLAVAAGLLLSFAPVCLHAGSENTATGTGVLPSNTGSDNTGDGYAALLNNTSGSDNTALGAHTLVANTTGGENTAVGFGSLYLNTTGIANTALGVSSLLYNTTGGRNTAVGHSALENNTTASDNAATGYEALFNNTGNENTATGGESLYRNTSGYQNTADGYGALFSNTKGSDNVADGYYCLLNNTTGNNTTASGYEALASNTTGYDNVADGYEALFSNTTGYVNTAIGINSLYNNTTGNYNTATGDVSLYYNTTGSYNVALGAGAGEANTVGSFNVDIASEGAASDIGVIRIGDSSNQTQTLIAGIYGVTASGGAAVYIASNGQLGTQTSSARYKQDIRDMDKASDALYALRPVSFRYKPEYDAAGLAQFGLVAEEVEKVAPELVIHEKDGKPYSVRYEQINAMLLNEFLKEHSKVEAQATAITGLRQELAAQAALLQKLSARLDAGAPAPSPAENRAP